MVAGFWLIMLTMFQMRPARLRAASYSCLSSPAASASEKTLILGIRTRHQQPHSLPCGLSYRQNFHNPPFKHHGNPVGQG